MFTLLAVVFWVAGLGMGVMLGVLVGVRAEREFPRNVARYRELLK